MPYETMDKPEELPVHNFKETPVFEGVLKRKMESKQYKTNNYVLANMDGEEFLLWGKTALRSQLDRLDLGTRVKIEFKGMKHNPKSGNTFEEFEVQVWKD